MADPAASWREFPVVMVRSQATWDDLPDPLVSDILTRLPVKTLITSTTVNKSWYALIKNPKFISDHIKRSISTANNNGESLILFAPDTLANSSNTCSLFYEKTGVVEISKFKIPFSTNLGTINIVGCCNGLVCLTERYPMNVFLWNPSVGKHVKIEGSCYSNLVSFISVLGFGQHRGSNDYRVVRIVYCCNDYSDIRLSPKVEVYSLKSRSWRKINARAPLVADYKYRRSPVYSNGCVYWLKMTNPHGARDQESMMSFDFTTEVFREVKLPVDIRKGFEDGYDQVVMDYKGSVSVFAHDANYDKVDGQKFCVWVMEDNGSWSQKLKFVLPVSCAGVPMKFTKHGNLFIDRFESEMDVKGLFCVKLDTLQFQKFGNDDGPHTLDVDFVETLVLL